MMNSNPWNVASIDDFSFFNCPECDFHAKEKKNFQDHATKNHPLSAVLFSKEVISFLKELNQLKQLGNDQILCKELELKHRLPDKIVSNKVLNVKKGQPVQKIFEKTKKDFYLPTETVKIISLEKKEKLKKESCDENAKPEEVFQQINFSDVPVEVIEVDYNDFVQIDSSNSNELISYVNCNEFQGFQANNPVLPGDTEHKFTSASPKSNDNLNGNNSDFNPKVKKRKIEQTLGKETFVESEYFDDVGVESDLSGNDSDYSLIESENEDDIKYFFHDSNSSEESVNKSKLPEENEKIQIPKKKFEDLQAPEDKTKRVGNNCSNRWIIEI